MPDLICASELKSKLSSLVEPYLAKRESDGFFERVSGQKIYYRHFTADSAQGTLVLVHGFTEGVDKFREMVYYFLNLGLNVWQIQQREHGKSYRSTPDPDLIYIEDYNDLVNDLHYFVENLVKKDPQTDEKKLYLYGHSMGGGVSAIYLERWPDDFSKAILSSPMLELNAGGTPVWAASAMAHALIALGRGKTPMPGSVPFSGKPDFENSCTYDRTRYEIWFEKQKEHRENQMCVTCFQTALEFLKITKEATAPGNIAKVKAKVLLLQASDDQMVLPGGQKAFIAGLGNRGKLVRFEKAKHELYIGEDRTLEQYWKEIEDFLSIK